MINFVLIQSAVTIEVEPPEKQRYPLEEAADRAGVHPEVLRYYCRNGMLGAARAAESEPVFDDDALYQIRRIEHYRRNHGVNLTALPLFVDLVGEVERLRAEVRRLQG